ncbi:BamA/TamA family outer membrane protein [candidate division KSB1 bacterium]|nr:BamA/TamA family outer membrane protein [candidate division KSB1 bacterium]
MRGIFKYRHWFLIILVTAAFVYPEEGQRVTRIRDIIFHGVNRIPLQEVKTWFGLRPDMPYNPADLIKRGEDLLRNYAEQDFFFARIDSITFHMERDSSRVDVRVYVHEGRPVQLGTLQLVGIDSIKALQLKSRFDSKAGQTFQLNRMEADIDDALGQMEKDGHPFCRFELQRVTLDSVSEKQQGFSLNWKVIYGPQLYLREILVIGNKITKQNVIVREIRIKPGDKYQPGKVARVKSRLMRTGYFTRVSEPEIYLSSGQDGGMLIRVEEGNASRFDGVIGYNPGSGSGKGYFTGLIDISLGNLFGTGRALQAHWQKRDRKTQDIKLYYREPWVAGYPLHLGIGFTQLIQDTTYVQREVICDINLPLYENLALTAQLNRVEVSPDSLGSYQFGLLHSRTLAASIGVEYDSRDDRINPKHGVYYQTLFQSGSKKNYGPAELVEGTRKNISNKRMTLDFELYTPLFNRQILAWFLHGRQIRSNEKSIPLPDQFRLGGAKSLRGYREDQFRGTEVAWTTLEYRYWLGRRSRAFVFADYGYYGSRDDDSRTGRYKLGYGIGFRLQTGLGVMSIDYGLGYGDDLLNGKIHVGLINEF